LVQMEGMRFGTLPIVTPTGGLADTVKDLQTGLVMEKEVDQDSVTTGDVAMLMNAITRACKLFLDQDQYRAMQKSAMSAAAGFSWRESARQYIEKFRTLW
jgi:glycogen synthase